MSKVPKKAPEKLPNSGEISIWEQLWLYEGVGQGSGREDSANLHHNYYQWVGLLLVLQAAASYAPWAAWKWAEGGRVGKLLARVKSDPMTETAVEEQVKNG